jgi:hypothetical protein
MWTRGGANTRMRAVALNLIIELMDLGFEGRNLRLQLLAAS